MTDEPPKSEAEAGEPAVIEIEAEAPPPPAAPVDAVTADAELKAAVKGEASPAPSAPAAGATSPTTSTSQTPASATPASTAAPTAAEIAARKRAGTKRAKTEDDEDEADDGPKPPRRWPLVVGALAIVAGGITALVLAGKANHRKLYFHCGAKAITAQRGRSFPPWGKERIGGEGWRPIALDVSPATECTDRATKDPIELEGWYLDALVEQATLALEVPGGNALRAKEQLEQALLLARSPDRRDQRKDIDRLLADVTYVGAAARVTAAAEQLRAAAKDFDDAAGRRPRHAADAAAWAGFARATADRLKAGPSGEPAAPAMLTPALPGRPPAPPGVALPVEPPVDAGVLTAPDVDAGTPGIPGGGVLM